MFDIFKKEAGSIASKLKEAHSRREKLLRERELIKEKPLSKEAVYKQICQFIDERVKIAREQFTYTFNAQLTNFQEHPPEILRSWGTMSNTNVNPDMLYLLFGDSIKEAVRKELEFLPWCKDACSSIEFHFSEIARLDREIIAAESKYEDMRQAAESAGLNVDRIAPPSFRRKHNPEKKMTFTASELVKVRETDKETIFIHSDEEESK